MAPRHRHERVFRWLLRLFPAAFRADYGEQMASDFRDQHDAASIEGRPAAVRRLWRRTVLDLLRSAPGEHLDELTRDIGLAWRLMRRQPLAAAGAVFTLALGIGLNVAVFAFVHGILLQALPLEGSAGLVRIYDVSPPPKLDLDPASSANLIDWRANTKTLDGIAIVNCPSATLLGAAWPERIAGMAVSEDFFRVVPFGLQIGRLFNDEDYALQRAFIAARTHVIESAGGTAVILSDDLWQRQFGRDPAVIGRRITLDARTLEVVGVLKPGFPLKDFNLGSPIDYWIPQTPDPAQRRARYFMAVGRLKPGVSLDAAQAEFSLIGGRLAQEYPEANAGRTVRLEPLLRTMTKDVATRLWLVFSAALCVLVIGVANVAGLLLAQASGRRVEMATRVALGASRGRLMRQVVTESLVMGMAGGTVGVALAAWAVPAIVAASPPGMSRVEDVAVSGPVLAFGFFLSLGVGALCGLAACWQFGRLHARPCLRSAIGGSGTHARRLREGLTVVQIALALVLTIGAGLLVRTLHSLDAQPLGYDPSHTIAIDLPLGRALDRKAMEETARVQMDLADRLRRIPDVVAAGIGPRVAAGAGDVYRTSETTDEQAVAVQVISPGFAEALGVVRVAGRLFTREDVGGPPVLLLNEAARRLFFGATDPVGRTLVHAYSHQALTILGVITDVRAELDVAPRPTVYALLGQNKTFAMSTLLVRGQNDPRALLPAIRTIVNSVNPNTPLTRVMTLEKRLDESMASRRFMGTVVGAFSGLALLLAMMGIYGLLAESVTSRVPEIGVRMALGATTGHMIWMIVVEGAILAAVGITVGLGGAVLLHSTLSVFVFGVSTTDPVTYACVSLLLFATALSASVLPASRASSVDPVEALRCE
jgi:putative ABC transport system permease protein